MMILNLKNLVHCKKCSFHPLMKLQRNRESINLIKKTIILLRILQNMKLNHTIRQVEMKEYQYFWQIL